MNKLKDAIIGFVVGDAFGVPYEFSQRDCVKTFSMIGFGTHNQPAGTWSDDTSMIIAEMVAIRDHGLKNLKISHIMDNFTNWLLRNEFTPYGNVFDVGTRTLRAIYHYNMTGRLLLDNDINSNGNGSLMRILPFAFFDEVEKPFTDIISSMTHPHEISKDVCWLYVQIIRELSKGNNDLVGIIKNIDTKGYIDIDSIVANDRDSIKSTGYVVDSLNAALWAFYNSISYKDAIIKATDLGGDTDTIAAITGGMAGLWYGIEAIPNLWKCKIARYDEIIQLCDTVNKSSSR